MPNVEIRCAVEGVLDEAVAERLLATVGLQLGPIYGRMGKEHLLNRLIGFNNSARHIPWFVIVDLNAEHTCAPEFIDRILPNPARLMCFRIAVREIESWLMADRERFAAFLDIPLTRVPDNPDLVHDPKKLVVKLARLSQSRRLREDIVPRTEGGRVVGPGYTQRMREFVLVSRSGWRPDEARRSSPSLGKCIDHLNQIRRILNVARKDNG